MPTAAKSSTARLRTSKDVWADADYWFGPDGGVTAMVYRGSKDQVQNAGMENEFTYRPTVWRSGVFGNYLFFDKLDILGGYIRSQDDWQWVQNGPLTNYIANTYRGEADYYIKTGTVIMARIDRGTATISPQPACTRGPGVSAPNTLLLTLGNVVCARLHTQEHDGDPVALVGTTDKLFKFDVRFMW